MAKEYIQPVHIENLLKEVNLQVDHQKESRRQEITAGITSNTPAQEAFDLIQLTPKFRNFINKTMFQSYCPPDEWVIFRRMVIGIGNEIIADEVLNTMLSKKGKVLLDSSHTLPIMTILFPNTNIVNHGASYDFELNSIEETTESCHEEDESVNTQNKPRAKKRMSPDYILYDTKGQFIYFGETSLKTAPNYWGYKVRKFKEMKSLYKDKNDFKPYFKNSLCQLALPFDQYLRRNQLVKRNGDIAYIPLPYTVDEYREFMESFIPEDPSNIKLNPQHIHWSKSLDQDLVTV